MKEIEYKLDDETARAELDRLADTMDIDLTIDESLEEKERKESQKNIDNVVKAIRRGSLIVNENGEAVFTPTRSQNVAPITFREPTGSTFLAADKYGEKQKMHKLYAMIAEMTGVENSTFSRLKKPDLLIVIAVGSIFLG